jgi:hypothetical protein
VNVDGSVIPVLPLANIDVYGCARMVFFDDHRATFFHYYGRRGGRGCGCVSGNGGHWRLYTCGDTERDADERQPGFCGFQSEVAMDESQTQTEYEPVETGRRGRFIGSLLAKQASTAWAWK